MTDVEMITLYGSIYTEVGDVTVTGEGGGGIRALSSSVAEDGGHTTILANSVTTVGDYITGVRSIAMRSSNEIRVGEVSTTGRQSVGILIAAAPLARCCSTCSTGSWATARRSRAPPSGAPLASARP